MADACAGGTMGLFFVVGYHLCVGKCNLWGRVEHVSPQRPPSEASRTGSPGAASPSMAVSRENERKDARDTRAAVFGPSSMIMEQN